MFCKVHMKSVTILNPTLDGKSLRDCQMCREVEINPVVNDNLSIEQLRDEWNNAFEIVCKRSSDFATQHKFALEELKAWLLYEKACWNIGIQLRQHLNNRPIEIRELLQWKIQDTSLRNHSNTNKTYCFLHKQCGDSWPWRSTKSKYNTDCGICIVQTQTQVAQYTKMDDDDDDEKCV